MTNKTPKCLTCGDEFESYYELAKHLNDNRKTHKLNYGTRKWIAKMLAVNVLSAKNRREMPHRAAKDPDYEPTELGEENRANAKRQLSGENQYVNTQCPQCRVKSRQLVEQEYAVSERAWVQDDRLLICCSRCTSH